MPDFNCPRCGIKAEYIEKTDGSYTVKPRQMQDELDNCIERRERQAAGQPFGPCTALAREAQRLRNRGRSR
jgi:hypothetical protein